MGALSSRDILEKMSECAKRMHERAIERKEVDEAAAKRTRLGLLEKS